MMFAMTNIACLLMVMIFVCGVCDTVRPTENEESVCSEKKCGKFSYKKIIKRFPGVFYNQKQIAKIERQFSFAREKYLEGQGVTLPNTLPGDGDSCCPTEILSFTNFTMENIYGETKYIVHTPPKYQFIPHGFCVEGGMCDGKCVNEPVTQSLLTYNPEKAKLEFDLFVVPGYCSCKAS